MIVKTTKPTEGKNGIIPAGTVISAPDAYRLVQVGVADPEDGECVDKLKEIEVKRAAKQEQRNLLKAAPVAPPAVEQKQEIVVKDEAECPLEN